MLIHDYSPKDRTKLCDKYKWALEMYNKGHTYVILNNVSVFGPFVKPMVPWDISTDRHIAIYNEDVQQLIKWIIVNIVLPLPTLTYKSRDVLIRIATGMLNKIDIPDCLKIMYHDNMVRNIIDEHHEIICDDLPF